MGETAVHFSNTHPGHSTEEAESNLRDKSDSEKSRGRSGWLHLGPLAARITKHTAAPSRALHRLAFVALRAQTSNGTCSRDMHRYYWLQMPSRDNFTTGLPPKDGFAPPQESSSTVPCHNHTIHRHFLKMRSFPLQRGTWDICSQKIYHATLGKQTEKRSFYLWLHYIRFGGRDREKSFTICSAKQNPLLPHGALSNPAYPPRAEGEAFSHEACKAKPWCGTVLLSLDLQSPPKCYNKPGEGIHIFAKYFQMVEEQAKAVKSHGNGTHGTSTAVLPPIPEKSGDNALLAHADSINEGTWKILSVSSGNALLRNTNTSRNLAASLSSPAALGAKTFHKCQHPNRDPPGTYRPQRTSALAAPAIASQELLLHGSVF